MTDQAKLFDLKLPIDDINIILGHLGQGQFQVVADLIANIRAQVLPQMKPAAPVPPAEDVKTPPAPEAEKKAE